MVGKKSVNKTQIILPFVILTLGILAFLAFKLMKKPPEEKKKIDTTPIVAVEAIKVRPLILEVSSYGVVHPKYETTLIAQVTGEIVELSDTFIRGGFVNKGQLLARIDPNDYHAALIDAQASMASARAALEKEVAQGKVAEREWKQITDTSPTELSLRKPQLAQELARVKSAQAAILRAERNLQRTEIRAPYDAMVAERSIGLGAFVNVGKQMGKVLATNTAEIRLPVADNQLQFLHQQGLNAQVKLTGNYAGKAVQWLATITRSEGVIDNKSRMSYLVVEINDPYLLRAKSNTHTTNTTSINNHSTNHIPLRFGSYVQAKILGIEIANASIIPRYLVVNNRLAILDNDLKLHYATVDIVRQQGGDVIVANGLLDGDQLIVSALDYPIEGMKLALANNNEKQVSSTENTKTQISNQTSNNEE